MLHLTGTIVLDGGRVVFDGDAQPAVKQYLKVVFGELAQEPEPVEALPAAVGPDAEAEVAEAEAMMRRAGIRWLSTTTKSIEEIATTILQELQPDRLIY